MQRLIEATLVNKILKKYEDRLKECETRWDKDYEKHNRETDPTKLSFLVEDMNLVNVQISAYECIVKDLKELVK